MKAFLLLAGALLVYLGVTGKYRAVFQAAQGR